MKMYLLLLTVVLPFACKADAAEFVDGFITSVRSSTQFYLGSTRVDIEAKAQCGTTYLDSDIMLLHPSYFGLMPADNKIVLRDDSERGHSVPTPCNATSWHVGQRVHVVADPGEGTKVFKAIQVTVYSVTFRHRLDPDPYSGDTDSGLLDEGHTGVLLEEKPLLRHTASGWEGVISIDGYPISVDKDISLLEASADTRLEYKSTSFWGGMKMVPVSKQPPASMAPDASFSANTWAAYQGDGFQDGEPYLGRVELWPNQVSQRERSFNKRLTPTIVLPDYAEHTDGSIKFASGSDGTSLAILSDGAVQHYVQRLGESLIPQYQRALPDTDPTKIRFQFLVVQQIDTRAERYFYKYLNERLPGSRGFKLPFGKTPAWNEAAVALPNGLIMISLEILRNLHSEAELASLLSYSITTVIQKQSYLSATAVRVGGGGIRGASYERAIRISIRQLYLDGYDFRDAPGTWAHAQGKQANNPVIGSSHPDQSIPWYEAYAFDYISKYYLDVDYSKLKRGEAEYKESLDELRKADPAAFADSSASRNP